MCGEWQVRKMWGVEGCEVWKGVRCGDARVRQV